MEVKQIQDQVQVQEVLKCPRCDSSNTKFCYYNNYSLSQPRHFCKACKRYWTRGGTLRNVPVGGGYRKNKKVKRGNSIVGHQELISSSSSSTQVVNPSHLHQSSQGLDTSILSTRSHINNPFLYTLLTNNQPQLNLNPYSLKDTYGLTFPQFKVGGTAGDLGFSSLMSQKTGGTGEFGFSSVTSRKTSGVGELGFSSVTAQKTSGTAEELGFSSVTSQNLGITHGNMSLASLNIPLVSSTYIPIFGTSTSTSTMATSQQKVVTSGFNDIAQTHYGSIGFDDLQMMRNSNNEGFDLSSKNVKMEGYGSWFDSQTNQNYIQDQIDSMDPSFMWNSSSSNIGC